MHTPHPWSLGVRKDTMHGPVRFYEIFIQHTTTLVDRIVAVVGAAHVFKNPDGKKPNATNIDNAALMAASPQMLKTLQSLKEDMKMLHSGEWDVSTEEGREAALDSIELIDRAFDSIEKHKAEILLKISSLK